MATNKLCTALHGGGGVQEIDALYNIYYCGLIKQHTHDHHNIRKM